MQGTKVFLNGRWIGIHRDPDELKLSLLRLRRAESISTDISVVYDHSLNEIRVNNDWGRVCRPLYVVEKGDIKLTKREAKQMKVRSQVAEADCVCSACGDGRRWQCASLTGMSACSLT
jgi:DNA-directed RNA polymerase beta subunit